MSAAEIIVELPRLGPAEPPEVQANLRKLFEPPHVLPKINSPRLARPEQSKGLTKQVLNFAEAMSVRE